MAQAFVLQPEDVRILDTLRQRLYHLTESIGSLRSGTSLDTLVILNQHVKAIADYLSENADLLSRLVVYPQTNFPGRTQEALLTQIVRKKLEQPVEAWADVGREKAQLLDHDLPQSWEWASEWVYKRVVTYVAEEASDLYTREEHAQGIDTVNTGLNDDWDGPDGDEEEDGREGQDGNGRSREEMKDIDSPGDIAATGAAGQEPVPTQLSARVAGGKDPDELLKFATVGH